MVSKWKPTDAERAAARSPSLHDGPNNTSGRDRGMQQSMSNYARPAQRKATPYPGMVQPQKLPARTATPYPEMVQQPVAAPAQMPQRQPQITPQQMQQYRYTYQQQQPQSTMPAWQQNRINQLAQNPSFGHVFQGAARPAAGYNNSVQSAMERMFQQNRAKYF